MIVPTQLRTILALTTCSAIVITAAVLGAFTTEADKQAAVVARGRYLVTIGGCNDCHTPWKMGPNGPEKDKDRILSGHPENVVLPYRQPSAPWHGHMAGTAFAGPWGVSFAANLTPDANTGIGIWTEEIFMNTIRSGRHWGAARPILPPMPWSNYKQMSDDDLKAVYAYLRTVKPVHNRVPEPLAPVVPRTTEARSEKSEVRR